MRNVWTSIPHASMCRRALNSAIVSTLTFRLPVAQNGCRRRSRSGSTRAPPGNRRTRVALWHECKDLDLALWLGHLDSLDALRRAKARVLRTLWDEASIGIASHQVDVFILEPVTDRYLGRLCDFNACPKGKVECRVPGCGDVALLRQHEGFRWRPESLAEGRAVRLFDRATGLHRRAADLPFLEVDAR